MRRFAHAARWMAAASLCLAISVPAGAAVRYVSQTAPGPAHNGASWMTAFSRIQDGLDAAAPGDEVWVAAGTYGEPSVALKSGVGLYGGFAGNETRRAQRNSAAHPVILDGGRYGVLVTAQYLPELAVFDGFTIRHRSSLQGYGDSGGAIECEGSVVAITNNRLIGNGPTGNSGRIVCERGTALIAGNVLMQNASGIETLSANATIINNIVARCVGEDSAGIHVGGGTAFVANNTLVGNRADARSSHGGALSCDQGAVVTAVNNLIAFNRIGVFLGDATLTLRHNDVYGSESQDDQGIAPVTGVDGNVSMDPRLADVVHGDFHIQPNSPCRDAGDASAVQPGDKDVDGQPRIQGAKVDIGADESDGRLRKYAPRIVRVRPGGNDAADGSTWARAKRTVQAGVDAAEGAGEVWVAAGTYAESVTLRNNVALLGGFSGTEARNAPRDPQRNVTTLISSYPGGSGRSVVVIPFEAGGTMVDGFTIRHDGPLPYFGETFYLAGGGIQSLGHDAAITHNVVANNAAVTGGGIYSTGPHALIAFNTVAGNVAAAGSDQLALAGGGGISVLGPSIVRNNFILRNRASAAVTYSGPQFYSLAEADGGGVDCSGDIVFQDNVVAGNTAGAFSTGDIAVDGGGLSYGGGTLLLANNTFTGNTSAVLGYPRTYTAPGGAIQISNASGRMVNNIFAFNASGNAVSNGIAQDHNILFNNGASPNNGMDPLFVDAANGDFRLRSGSPAIDAGDNAVVASNDTDAAGNPRIQGASVDLGALETPSVQLKRRH